MLLSFLKKIKKIQKTFKKPLTNLDCYIIIYLADLMLANRWRNSSAGQSTRFIPEVSQVQVLFPLPYGPVVKRLRHRPFTAVTRVRFSSGSPNIFAGVVEQADTRDLKSLGHCDRTGSSPVTGTMKRSIVVRQQTFSLL